MKSLIKSSLSLLMPLAIAGIPLIHPLLISQPLYAQSSRLNIRQEGRLDQGSHQTYEFRAEFNQFVTISLNSRQFDSYLELYDPDGRLIAENDNANGTNSQIRVNLPTTGVYTVVIKGARNPTRGNYTLAIQENGGQTPAEPRLPQPPRNSQVREGGWIGQRQINRHNFSGQAGQTVTIAVESNQFNPLVTVFDPDEFAVASNGISAHNPDPNRFSFKLSKTGTYQIHVQGKVQSNGLFEAGEYTLTINRS